VKHERGVSLVPCLDSTSRHLTGMSVLQNYVHNTAQCRRLTCLHLEKTQVSWTHPVTYTNEAWVLDSYYFLGPFRGAYGERL
jgi:hypothetical protein